jgi:hypothetical protein
MVPGSEVAKRTLTAPSVRERGEAQEQCLEGRSDAEFVSDRKLGRLPAGRGFYSIMDGVLQLYAAAVATGNGHRGIRQDLLEFAA